jgi:hypothetical protein
MTASEAIRSRPRAGEEDAARMYDLVAARPGEALHLADLPWRLCSPAARTPDHTRLWEDDRGDLLAWAVLQFPWHCLDYAVSAVGERRGVAAAVMAWATERLEGEANRRGAPLPFSVSARADDAARIALIERHGFVAGGWRYLHLARDLEEPVPRPRLADGFRIRALAGAGEVEAAVALQRRPSTPRA